MGFPQPFPQSPVNQPVKLQPCRTVNHTTCPWQSGCQGLHTQQRSRLPRQRRMCSCLIPRRRLAGFLPSLRKPLNQRACSHSSQQPQLSAGDHLQQYQVPAGLICSSEQLVQPRDSSTQMIFPSCDKRLLYTDSPTVPSLGLTADGAEFRRTVGDQEWVTSSPPTGRET